MISPRGAVHVPMQIYIDVTKRNETKRNEVDGICVVSAPERRRRALDFTDILLTTIEKIIHGKA